MRIASIFKVFTGLIAAASAASFSNPLKPTNGSDPHIAYSGGYYYLMTTTWTNLQITRAKTLEGLKTGQTKVVWTDKDSSRCCNLWAPELHWVDNRWVCHWPSLSSTLGAESSPGGTFTTLRVTARTWMASAPMS
jgi:GH43 family beta-xylosidase